jgi:hypothetical protein
MLQTSVSDHRLFQVLVGFRPLVAGKCDIDWRRRATVVHTQSTSPGADGAGRQAEPDNLYDDPPNALRVSNPLQTAALVASRR